MRQLSGLDSAFLHLETARTPMHIGGLSLYDPSQSTFDSFSLAAASDFVERRLHLAPTLRRRLVQVPLGLDYPYWIEDPEFSIQRHFHHLALPPPGNWSQLCELVASLHATPLDRSRPLWELHFVEGLDAIDGLPRGSYAVLSKIHHAAIDGVAGTEILVALNDLGPDSQPPPPEQPWQAESAPSATELLGRACVSPYIRGARGGELAVRALPALGRLAWGLGRRRIDLPEIGFAPRTRFNHTVSSSRVFGGRGVSLGDVKSIKGSEPGATVNDAVLAVCGGALRRYLGEKGELPDASLVAMAPVSVRRDDKRGVGGNQVSLILVSLGTHLADPRERLRHVHQQALGSKGLSSAVGSRLLTEATGVLPPMPSALAALLYGQLGLANRVPPLFNCIVTNVPGPQFPLYSAGSRLAAHYGLGPIGDGVGLMLPVFSYRGEVFLSVISCADMVPDPEVLAQCLEDSFLELRGAVRRRRRRAEGRRQRTGRRGDSESEGGARRGTQSAVDESSLAAAPAESPAETPLGWR